MAGWNRPPAPGGGPGAYAFDRGDLRQRHLPVALQLLKRWGVKADKLAHCDVSTAGGTGGGHCDIRDGSEDGRFFRRRVRSTKRRGGGG